MRKGSPAVRGNMGANITIMKTYSRLGLGISTTGALALAAFVTAAMAGPGPQFWNRPQPTNRETKSTPAAAAKCDGCKESVRWTISDRGPAGKGVPGSSIASRSHTCGSCTGTILNEKGAVKDGMAHGNACARLQCCK